MQPFVRNYLIMNQFIFQDFGMGDYGFFITFTFLVYFRCYSLDNFPKFFFILRLNEFANFENSFAQYN
ncbi:MAG: hypothetical protein A2X08_13995 [Bacteroidetes bacterium GWA2_32_17]|nr:MAG: hypothetical protein A2X08_13995 [Bacteroidetes bacterium GWA2_32_17]